MSWRSSECRLLFIKGEICFLFSGILLFVLRKGNTSLWEGLVYRYKNCSIWLKDWFWKRHAQQSIDLKRGGKQGVCLKWFFDEYTWLDNSLMDSANILDLWLLLKSPQTSRNSQIPIWEQWTYSGASRKLSIQMKTTIDIRKTREKILFFGLFVICIIEYLTKHH